MGDWERKFSKKLFSVEVNLGIYANMNEQGPYAN
jgi:hypothetical protein